ncbi:hypothetical protein AM232_26190 [Bacillus sp. FJAT-21352]|nr:hypothetical protein AM232_26190 [Bacillus sp. FJAT-21352]
MANKKKLKQRKKRQLKRTFKQANKVVKVKEVNSFSSDYLPPYEEPAVNTNEKYEAKDQTYQEALDKVYGGTVTALTHYLNNRSSMTFKCNECGLIFFNKAGHMIGENVKQRHRCHRPYGTTHGDSPSSHVSNMSTRNKKKPPLDMAELDRMIWDDYSYQEIAKTLQCNPKIIKNYFIEEGLL